MDSIDVLVAGGGPAGSTTATLLARAGLRVLVLEKDQFPRFHVGESMLPQSVRIWKRLGVLEMLHERFLVKYSARFLDGRDHRVAEYSFDEAFDSSASYAFQVPRADFDDLLLRHSERSGADVRHGWEVKDAIWDGDRVIGAVVKDPDGNRHEIRARVVVDATGRDTLMASRGGTKKRYPGLDKTAMFSHFEGVARQSGKKEGTVDIIVFDHGWMWNIPFKNGINSCGMALQSPYFKSRRPGETLDAFFDRNVQLTDTSIEMFGKSTKRNPVRALADFSYRVERYGGKGWVIVGDAAGFIDPLFSTGAHLAFFSGERVADEIVAALGAGRDVDEDTWREYGELLRFGTDLFVGGVQSFYRGELLHRIFENNQRKVLRQSITSMLSGDVFNPNAPWMRFMRQQCRADLPDEHAEQHPDGATPMMSI